MSFSTKKVLEFDIIEQNIVDVIAKSRWQTSPRFFAARLAQNDQLNDLSDFELS